MTNQGTGNRLEKEFDQAKRSGRWLSEEEIQALAQQEQDQLDAQEREASNRRKLIVLTGVCILLPPLWPLALALTLTLLYPTTMKRVGVVSGVILVALAVMSTVGVLALMLWLLRVLL